MPNVTTPSPTGKWRLEGYDTFDGSYYAIDGEYASEAEARIAASERLDGLEKSQPSKTSGEQSGIQDQVYIIGPDGKRERFLATSVEVAEGSRFVFEGGKISSVQPVD